MEKEAEQNQLKSKAEEKLLVKEREMKEKQLDREVEEKQVEREIEEKRFEMEAKLQSEKLAGREPQNEILGILGKRIEISADISEKTGILEHWVHFAGDRRIRCRPYALPYVVREIQEEIQEMINTGIVRESNLPYLSPMVVGKKKDGSNRICVDYRKMNRITVTDLEPMTTAEDLFQKLG